MIVKKDCVDSIVENLIDKASVIEQDVIFYTGFWDFDEKHGALKAGEIYLLASAPGMGKTAFALNLVNNGVNVERDRILYLSKKEKVSELVNRLVAMRARYVEGSQISSVEYRRIVRRLQDLHRESIEIENVKHLSKDVIETFCKQRGELDLLVVDEIDLHGDKECCTLLLNDLRTVAEEYHCPVVVLGEIEKDNANRSEHRPLLQDMQGLEKYVDSVILLYRDEVYDADTEMRGLAEINVAKTKNCEPFIMQLAYLCEYQFFGNLD